MFFLSGNFIYLFVKLFHFAPDCDFRLKLASILLSLSHICVASDLVHLAKRRLSNIELQRLGQLVSLIIYPPELRLAEAFDALKYGRTATALVDVDDITAIADI